MDDLDQLIRPLILKDLRIQLRARGCNPAGGADELKQRLKENMIATGNFSTNFVDGGNAAAPVYAGTSTADMHQGSLVNNYHRPGGMQNVGNFLTDKPSSRVLAPPGGGSQIMFGDYQDPHTQRSPPPAAYQQHMQQNAGQHAGYAGPQAPYGMQQSQPHFQQSPYPTQQPQPRPYGTSADMPFGASSNEVRTGSLANNYSRPGGQQNVGNFLTDRPSSKVLAPPGGKSQISFG